MAISYEKTNWVNGSGPAINADNLNKIETGIKNATDEVNGIAAHTPTGVEAPLAGISLHGTNYKIAAGLPDGTAPGQAMIYNGTEWQKQEGYGYEAFTEALPTTTFTLENASSTNTIDLSKFKKRFVKKLTTKSNDETTNLYMTMVEDPEIISKIVSAISLETVGETCNITINGVESAEEVSAFYDEYAYVGNIQMMMGEPTAPGDFLIETVNYDGESMARILYCSTETSETIDIDLAIHNIGFNTINPKLISENGFGYIINNSQKEFSIEWDGNTEGKEPLGEMYYKVSDMVLTGDDVLGCIGIASLEGETISLTANASNTVVSEHGGYCIYFGEPVILFSDGSLVIEETTVGAGVWFVKMGDYGVITCLTSINKIDSKYIEPELPKTTTAGTAAIFDGEKWTAQNGYGYSVPGTGTVLTWEGDIAGRDSFTATGLGAGYKVSNILPSNDELNSSTIINESGYPLTVSNVITVTQFAETKGLQIMSGDGSKARVAMYNSYPVVVIADIAQTIEIGDGSAVYITATFPSTGAYMCYEDANNYWRTVKYNCVSTDWDGWTSGQTPIELFGEFPMYKVSEDFIPAYDLAQEITATYSTNDAGSTSTTSVSALSEDVQFKTVADLASMAGMTVVSGDPTKVIVFSDLWHFLIAYSSEAQTLVLQPSGGEPQSYTFEAGTYYSKCTDTNYQCYVTNSNYGIAEDVHKIDSKYIPTSGAGLPAGTAASQALIWDGTQWVKQSGYGYGGVLVAANDYEDESRASVQLYSEGSEIEDAILYRCTTDYMSLDASFKLALNGSPSSRGVVATVYLNAGRNGPFIANSVRDISAVDANGSRESDAWVVSYDNGETGYMAVVVKTANVYLNMSDIGVDDVSFPTPGVWVLNHAVERNTYQVAKVNGAKIAVTKWKFVKASEVQKIDSALVDSSAPVITIAADQISEGVITFTDAQRAIIADSNYPVIGMVSGDLLGAGVIYFTRAGSNASSGIITFESIANTISNAGSCAIAIISYDINNGKATSVTNFSVPEFSSASRGQVLGVTNDDTLGWVSAGGLPEGTEASQALVYNGTEWTKQSGYGYAEDITALSETSLVMESTSVQDTTSTLRNYVIADNIGTHFTITWNSVVYDCILKVATKGSMTYYYLGNASIARGALPDTGEPFVYYFVTEAGYPEDDAWYWAVNSTGTYTVSVIMNDVNQIDTKFIPNADVLENSVENSGIGYGGVTSVINDGSSGRATIDLVSVNDANYDVDQLTRIDDAFTNTANIDGVSALFDDGTDVDIPQNSISSLGGSMSTGWIAEFSFTYNVDKVAANKTYNRNLAVIIVNAININTSTTYHISDRYQDITIPSNGLWVTLVPSQLDTANVNAVSIPTLSAVQFINSSEISKIHKRYLPEVTLPTITIEDSQISSGTITFTAAQKDIIEKDTNTIIGVISSDLLGADIQYFKREVSNASSNTIKFIAVQDGRSTYGAYNLGVLTYDITNGTGTIGGGFFVPGYGSSDVGKVLGVDSNNKLDWVNIKSVSEHATKADFPAAPQTDTIYVDKSTSKIYDGQYYENGYHIVANSSQDSTYVNTFMSVVRTAAAESSSEGQRYLYYGDANNYILVSYSGYGDYTTLSIWKNAVMQGQYVAAYNGSLVRVIGNLDVVYSLPDQRKTQDYYVSDENIALLQTNSVLTTYQQGVAVYTELNKTRHEYYQLQDFPAVGIHNDLYVTTRDSRGKSKIEIYRYDADIYAQIEAYGNRNANEINYILNDLCRKNLITSWSSGRTILSWTDSAGNDNSLRITQEDFESIAQIKYNDEVVWDGSNWVGSLASGAISLVGCYNFEMTGYADILIAQIILGITLPYVKIGNMPNTAYDEIGTVLSYHNSGLSWDSPVVTLKLFSSQATSTEPLIFNDLTDEQFNILKNTNYKTIAFDLTDFSAHAFYVFMRSFSSSYDEHCFYSVAPDIDGSSITGNHSYVAKFSANSSSQKLTITSAEISGGSGAVSSVNGKTGTVVLTGQDINVSTDDTTTIATALSNKQAALTPGNNIQINGTTISATDTKYTAGTNVTISADNKISATDTKYTQGSGITISGTTISADTSVVQPKLVSGTNIKTINSSSILSSGNITAVTSLGGSWGDISLDTTRLELVESSGGQLDVLTTVFPVGTSTGRTISEAGTTTLENIGIASGGCYVIRLIPENNTSMTDGAYPHTFMIDIVPGTVVNQYSTSTPEKPNAVWTSSLTLDVKFATANNFKTATIALEYHKLSTAGGSASITFSNVSAYAVKVTKLSD